MTLHQRPILPIFFALTIFTAVPARAQICAGSPSFARIDFVARDAANRDLGRRGEEFVIEFECRRLHDGERRPDLAARLEWTAQVRGDGAGYDLASFNADGSPRAIEGEDNRPRKVLSVQSNSQRTATLRSAAEPISLVPCIQLRPGRPAVHAARPGIAVLPS